MKVFISWSGQRGLAVAEALRGWLPDTIQAVKPWMSRRDLNAGVRWTPEINEQLSQTNFGIICLTPENQHAPWVMFEAGALAKTLARTHVVPYLIDMDASEVEGPLWQFQSVNLGEEGTFGLVQSINDALGTDALPKESLERVFKRGWPELESAFNDIPEAGVPVQQRRQSDEILREVLEVGRDISRRANDFPSRDNIRASGADVAPPFLAPRRSVVSTQLPVKWGDFVDMEKAKEKAREDAEEAEARLATLRGELGAYRRASREAEEDMRNAEERAKAMRDAVVADEQHEED